MKAVYDLGPVLTEISNSDIEAVVTGEEKKGPQVLSLTGLTSLWKFINMLASSISTDTIITAEEIGELATLACDDSWSTKVIHKQSSADDSLIFEMTSEELMQGSYSIGVRMRVSSISDSNNFMKIVVSSIAPDDTETQLDTIYVKPSYFSAENTWETISFGVNFLGKRGSSMKISFSSVSNSSNITYDIDYLLISPNGTALVSID